MSCGKKEKVCRFLKSLPEIAQKTERNKNNKVKIGASKLPIEEIGGIGLLH